MAIVSCPECNKKVPHDSPGATERFRTFLENHMPGASLGIRRNEMYSLRSAILHGSDLPIGISPLWVRWRHLISRADYFTSRAEKNLLERDVLIKKALGFHDETFTLLDRLLEPNRAASPAGHS